MQRAASNALRQPGGWRRGVCAAAERAWEAIEKGRKKYRSGSRGLPVLIERTLIENNIENIDAEQFANDSSPHKRPEIL